MTGIAITITDKGRAALVAASGTNAVTISAIGISATAVTPTVTATTLPGEIKRLSTFSGTVTDADTIHITIRDDSADSYALRAFALYLSDGTLFGIYGGDTLFMEKATGAMLMLAVDVQITGSNATAITFGDTNFLNPAATTEVQGVVELATETEAATGTDAKRAVTPKGMLAAVKSWLDARFGEGAPSAFVKKLLTSASAAALRTTLELKSAALEDATTFAAASHKHAIAEVTSLQATLDAKLATASYNAADVLAKLQTVDGSGSGLDADTLDGKHAASFALLSGATFTGAIAATGSGEALRLSGSYGGGIALVDSNGTGRIYMTDSSKINFAVSSSFPGKSGNAYIDITGIYYGGNLVWHAGNDGAGSGMDADMLDGRHASDFAHLSGAGFSALVTAPRFAAGWDSGEIGSFSCDNCFRSWGNTGWYNQSYAGGWYMTDPTWVRSYNDKPIYTGGRMRADGGFVVGGSEYPVFHSGNDGAGSGMDADTLDGKHASELAPTAKTFVINGTVKTDAATAWSGDQAVTITTGQALVFFHANWGTGEGPFYAQLYVDGTAWPGAWSEIGGTGGSDFVIAPCTIMALVTGLSSGSHTFSVRRTTGSDLTIYGGGALTVLQTTA